MPKPTYPSWQTIPARLAPTASTTSTRPRWRRRIVVLGAVLLLIAGGITVDLIHRAHSPFGIRGHFIIDGATNFRAGEEGTAAGAAGDDCVGTGTYAGLGQDQPIDITDLNNHVLATGRVIGAFVGTDQHTGETACDAVFDVARVPSGHSRYVVSFYGRLRHAVSADQLRQGVVLRSDDGNRHPD